jgi:hypothetical protein
VIGKPKPDSFRRLLAWYPGPWKRRNADILTDLLVEQAEAEGRTRPTHSDRRSLFFGGIQEHLLIEESPSRATLLAFAVALAFSAFYLFIASWAPNVRFAGTVGPFGNGTVIALVLLLVAFVSSISNRAGAARMFAYLAALIEIVVWAASLTMHGLGPSLTTALLFAGLAFTTGYSPSSVRQLAKFGGAIFLALVARFTAPMVVVEVMILLDPIGRGDPSHSVVGYVVLPLIGWTVATLAAAAGATLLFRSALRKRPNAVKDPESTI